MCNFTGPPHLQGLTGSPNISYFSENKEQHKLRDCPETPNCDKNPEPVSACIIIEWRWSIPLSRTI